MQLSQRSKADKIVNFLIGQIKENRTRFFTVIGFTLGIIILAGFVYIRLQTLNESASDRLAAAYMSLARGDQRQAEAHLNNAIVYSKNAPASYQARMVKADIMIENKDYLNALAMLKETEEKGKPELMRPLALSRIIYMYDQQKDYANAILYSNEFISKYDDNFLTKNIYLDLARYYILAQSPEEAKRVYGEIMTRFPATAEAEYAEKFLQGLQ
jgi:predicted negative regulator of RcsB-dependent stress response